MDFGNHITLTCAYTLDISSYKSIATPVTRPKSSLSPRFFKTSQSNMAAESEVQIKGLKRPLVEDYSDDEEEEEYVHKGYELCL